MDNILFGVTAARMPAMNRDILEGLATKHVKLSMRYLERIIRTVAPDFPPELTHIRLERCLPTEEFSVIARGQNPRKAFEISRSDVYMVKWLMAYNGHPMDPVYLYLPFVSRGGFLTLNGAQAMVSPVLADLSLSVTTNEIFIPLTRDRVRFWRTPKMFMMDGQPVSSSVVYSPLHHDSKSRSPTSGKTSLPHYLFARYGVHTVFGTFANATVVIGDGAAINTESYPADKWVICSSSKPASAKYNPPSIRLAIPREDWSDVVQSLVTGFFYVADLFPNRFQAEYFGDDGEVRLWMVLLGQLIWGGGVSEGTLYEDVLVHQDSLDGYVDTEIRATLEQDGIVVQDIYGLFMHIIETFSRRVAQSSSRVSSMYDKRLMVLRYLLYDIVHSFNSFMFKMKSSKKKPLSQDDIQQMATDFLRSNRGLSLSQGHAEVSSVAIPGDNMYWKGTSHLVLQADSANKKGGKRKGGNSDPSKHLHASIAEVGSYLSMNKSEATGRNKINPYLLTAEDGLILRNPELMPVIDRTQSDIQR